MEPEQINKLRNLAQKATQGPWVKVLVEDAGDYVAAVAGYRIEAPLARMIADMDQDADYIAAANPQAILALLDELERLQAELRDSTTLVSDLTAERDELAAKQAELEKQEPVGIFWRGRSGGYHQCFDGHEPEEGMQRIPLYGDPVPAVAAQPDEREVFINHMALILGADANDLAHMIAMASDLVGRFDAAHVPQPARPVDEREADDELIETIKLRLDMCDSDDGYDADEAAFFTNILGRIRGLQARAALQPAQGAQTLTSGYFAYDSDNGFELFDTSEKAKSWAQTTLDDFRDDARSDGEWHDDVDSIRWGVVLGKIEEIELPDDGYDGSQGLAGYSKPVDYKLVDCAQPDKKES